MKGTDGEGVTDPGVLDKVLQIPQSILGFLSYVARVSYAALFHIQPYDSLILLVRLLASSLPVVAVVAFFASAMLTVQAASSLALIGGGPLAGTLVGFGGVREVFPLLAAASVAARSGAAFASELGAMKVTEQLDALEVMGLSPLVLLVGPRIWAAIFGVPVCVLTANAVGLVGSQLIGTYQLGIDPGSMWYALMTSVMVEDLVIGMVKGLILGWLIAIVTTREGLQATGGARGAGQATNRAVVRALIATSLASLALTYLLYGGAAKGL
ncbi:MAG: ABC transporter permease [Deltaproteobacteria bacterium]|nr:ABC transporter permease [Deltaproteobacteria bacterium]